MSCCCCSKMHNACNKFRKKSLKFDGEKPSSSFYTCKVPTFFKIMIGDFAEIMVIPPKFARTLQGKVDKNIFLEDSNGNCWMIKLSATNGSLAFKEGWQDFVLHHSISLGEIVIFKQISISHFSVQVFGTSGSERLQFQGKENNNDHKRKQRKNEIFPDILLLSKAQKSYEASERFDLEEKENSNNRKGKRKKKETNSDILCLSKAQRRYEAKGKHHYDKDSSKKRKVEMNSPGDLDSKEIAAWDSPIVLSDDDDDTGMRIMSKRRKKKHKKKSAKEQVKNSKGTPAADNMSCDNCLHTTERKSSMAHKDAVQHKKKSAKKQVKNSKGTPAVDNMSTDNCLHTTERKSSMAHKDAVQNDEGVDKIIPTNSVNHETFQNTENPEDINISMVYERNIAHHEKAMAVDHAENKVGDAGECNTVHAMEKEVTQITPTKLPQPETFESKGRIINDTKGIEVNEELFHDRNSLEIPKPPSAADCTEREIKIHNEAPQVHNATMKHWMENGKIGSDYSSEPETFLNKLNDLEIVGHNYDRPERATPNCIEDGGRNLTVSKGFARKSLSYATDEDSKEKLEVNRDASISLCAIKGDCSILYVDAVGVIKKSASPSENSLEVCSNAPILNCNRSDQQNRQPTLSEGNLENYGDLSEAKPVKSNPFVTDVKPFQSGTVSKEFPEVNAKKVTPCSKEVLRVVKTEIVDSAHVMTSNYVEFSTTVTLSSQSWLLLPEKLPARLFRKKCLKNVVLLQDPFMKLWPVLYHGGLEFIGFVDGWEDFAIANNLQQGDTCQIESIDPFEPTLKVQLSKVQNQDSFA